MRAVIDAIERRPKLCVWEITSRCNMRCLHCASDFHGAAPRGTELSIDEALDLCRQLVELGCEKVVLSGGEALLHEGWQTIAAELRRLGAAFSLISNGFVLDAAVARQLQALGAERVGLSLDGLCASHNHVRQNPASFDRALAAASAVCAAGLPLNIITHVNRRNLGELEQLEELVVTTGASVWRLQLGAPVGGLARHADLVILPSDLPAVADFIVAARQRGRVAISVGDNIGYYSHHEQALRHTPERQGLDFWCGCSAGCLTIGIEANGNVKGCLSLQADRFVEGNIRDHSLREIWQRTDGFWYTRGFALSMLAGHCAGCELGEVCRGGCTFMAFGATGRPHDNPFCLHGLERRAATG